MKLYPVPTFLNTPIIIVVGFMNASVTDVDVQLVKINSTVMEASIIIYVDLAVSLSY